MVRFLFDLLRTHDPMKKSIGSIGSWIELSNVGSCIFSSDLELLRTETPLSVPTVGPRTALLVWYHYSHFCILARVLINILSNRDSFVLASNETLTTRESRVCQLAVRITSYTHS